MDAARQQTGQLQSLSEVNSTGHPSKVLNHAFSTLKRFELTTFMHCRPHIA